MKAAEQLAWTAILLLAGVIVLMLAGSLLFQPMWLVLLGVAGIGVAAYRLRGCVLPRYAVAQMLDRRFSLQDTLSTAYFLRSAGTPTDSTATEFQLAQADRLAATVSPEQSFAFSGQKIWAIAGLLAVICTGLFVTRYLLTESLSLRPALVSLQIAPVLERIHEVLSPKKDPARVDAMPSVSPATNKELADKQSAEAHVPQPEAPQPSPSNASADGQSAGQQTGGNLNKAASDSQAQAKLGEASLEKNNVPRDSAQSPGNQPADQANRTPAGQQTPKTNEQQASKSQNSSPGVMSRMKDALSSMMAKMQSANSNQQSKNGQQQANSEGKNGEQAQSSAGKPQQGNQSQQQQAQNQASNPNENAEGQAQGQTAEKQGTSQGKSSDQSAQRGSDAHSGVGQQDGDKDIQNAEQLKAMGKLAEILGKRSAVLTGEMTVETSSGKQQLKTNYSQKLGQHSDTGGEINRNQVPLVYQNYVREYMEQVRKQDKGSQ